MHRTKWTFWGVVLSATALICIPSMILWRDVSRYRRLAESLSANFVGSARLYFSPRKSSSPIERPSLEFARFSIKAPRAKTVELVGDFNNWKPGTLRLTPRRSGLWEISLPLPKGRYGYLFIVDGSRRRDSSNNLSEYLKGNQVSVIEVKGGN